MPLGLHVWPTLSWRNISPQPPRLSASGPFRSLLIGVFPTVIRVYPPWRDNPNAARWRWNRPYRWATWGAVASFFPWRWSDPSAYSYGEDIFYDGDEIYSGDDAIASSEEYAEQAQMLAAEAPEVDESSEWMPLGVFAVTQDGEASGAASP